MVAVTSIMRVHQILMARLNELLEPFGLTFPRYEALMLLHLSQPRLAAAGQDRRAAAGAPDQRHQHDRRAGEARARRAACRTRPTAGRCWPRSPPAGREVAEEATEALNEADFATEPLSDGDLDEPRQDPPDAARGRRRLSRLSALAAAFRQSCRTGDMWYSYYLLAA